MGRVYRKRRRANNKQVSVGSTDTSLEQSAIIGRLAKFCLAHGSSDIRHFRPYNFHGMLILRILPRCNFLVFKDTAKLGYNFPLIT